MAREVLQQLETGAVGPVQVIKEQRDGHLRRDGLQETRDRAEESLLLFLAVGSRRRDLEASVGKKATDVWPANRHRIVNGGRAAIVRGRQRVEKRIEGNRLMQLITATRGDQKPSVSGTEHHLLGQPSLAYTGLASQQDQPAVARRDGVFKCEEPLHLRLPRDQQRRRKGAEKRADGKRGLHGSSGQSRRLSAGVRAVGHGHHVNDPHGLSEAF